MTGDEVRLTLPPRTAQSRLVVVARARRAEDYDRVLDALIGAGIRSVELTLTTPGTLERLPRLLERFGGRADLGVGTVTDGDQLERAVRALKSGKVPDFDLSDERDTEIELHIPALIPDDYLPDVHTRLTLYKRIAGARDEFELRELQVEMIDRFGLLPQQVKNLFAIAALKLRATPLGIRKLDLGPRGGRVIFRDKPDIEPMTILRLIQQQPRVYKLEGQDKLRVTLELPGATERLRAANDLLDALAVKAKAA